MKDNEALDDIAIEDADGTRASPMVRGSRGGSNVMAHRAFPMAALYQANEVTQRKHLAEEVANRFAMAQNTPLLGAPVLEELPPPTSQSPECGSFHVGTYVYFTAVVPHRKRMQESDGRSDAKEIKIK